MTTDVTPQPPLPLPISFTAYTATRADALRFWSLVFLIGIYTQRSIYLNGTLLVPFAVSAVAAIPIYFHVRPMARDIIARQRRTLLLMGALLAVSAVVTGRGEFLLHVRSTAQLLLSLVINFVFFCGLLELGGRRTSSLLNRIFWTILAIAAFEVFLGGHELIYEISKIVHAGEPNPVYVASGRDEQMWGGVRPLVFASEPSLVGVALFTCASCGGLLKDKPFAPRSALVFIGKVILAFLIVRSVTIFGAVPLYLCGFLFLRNTRPKLWRILWQFSIILALLALAGYLIWQKYGAGLLLHAADYSTYVREIFPAGMAYLVARRWPVMGTGIGGWGNMDSMIWGLLAGSPQLKALVSLSRQVVIDSRQLIQNSFWLYWIFFGLGGGLAFLAMFRRFMQAAGLKSFAFVGLCTVVCWSAVGAFVDPRTWVFPFLFSATAIMVHRQCRAPAPAPA